MSKNEFEVNYLSKLTGKGEVTKYRAIKSTLRCIAASGFEGATIGEICRIGKLNKGLIVHHFGTRNELLNEAFAFVLASGAHFVGTYLETRIDIKNPIERYIRANFNWFNEHEDAATYYVALFSRSSYDKETRKKMHLSLNIACERIEGLIKENRTQFQFKKSVNVELLARAIHALVFGSVLLGNIKIHDHLSLYLKTCLIGSDEMLNYGSNKGSPNAKLNRKSRGQKAAKVSKA